MRISDWSSDVCSSDLTRADLETVVRAKAAIQLGEDVGDAAQIKVAPVGPDIPASGGAVVGRERHGIIAQAVMNLLAGLLISQLVKTQMLNEGRPATAVHRLRTDVSAAERRGGQKCCTSSR